MKVGVTTKRAGLGRGLGQLKITLFGRFERLMREIGGNASPGDPAASASHLQQPLVSGAAAESVAADLGHDTEDDVGEVLGADFTGANHSIYKDEARYKIGCCTSPFRVK